MSFPLSQPTTRSLTGGDLLAQSLKHIGVEVAFGLHGGHLDAFLMGCETVGIRLIDTRHETAAVQAAEGYAKVKGKLGVCFVTANSGFSNGIPGLATALADRSPILCITSSPPLRDAENNSLQGIIDQVVASRPLTKFAHRVTNAEDAPRIVSLAVRTALAGAPGPVLLDFPIDVLFSPVHEKLISWGSISSPMSYAPGPHVEAVKKAVELIQAASRPAVIIGSGAQSQETISHLLTLSKTTGIPVFDTQKCTLSSTLAIECKTYGGGAEKLGLLPVLGKLQPDLVLLLGARTGMFLAGRSGALIPPAEKCKLVQVDVDGTEIGRTLPVELGVISDVAQFLAAVNRHLSSSTSHTSNRIDKEWVSAVTTIQSLPSPFASDASQNPSGLMHPYHALQTLFTHLPKNPILITDGGECALWARDTAHLCSPSSILKSTGALGFLGNGFGYALGAAVASPDRTVINLHGDGSAGFHFMELDTYARLGLDVITVVVNNHCWGMSSNGQELVYGEKNPKRVISELSPGTRYDVVAGGLGNRAVRVEKVEDIPRAVEGLVSAENGQGQERRAKCIELVVDRKPIHPVTEVMVGQTEDEGVVVVPYYDNIPRAYYK
ncbi:thiamine pyrophosphate enzyme, N-terminal TPP binding domain-containing protein [Aspergillus pseudodeflectus]|uniref:Thiamine pyrophosphate enzyme, N-terminal TPP binding domain-containing protein n=1 Tax=Aspergillus pseudodeflectus TaxID=176178 RepID=A0ABR4K2D5_9EURO